MSSSQAAPTPQYSYVGQELELFALATNWKAYFRSQLAEVLLGDVLEVGAGLGETARHLIDGRQRSWLALEPDPRLAARLIDWVAATPLTPKPSVQIGTIADVNAASRFDAIIYIDVLEHIENDQSEVSCAAELLRPGGHLIVLSPAFNLLFSAFDESVGHYRRYTKASLAAIMPPSLRRRRLVYLDSVGFLASFANKALLRQSLPSARQLRLWDRVMVPASRVLDPVLGRRFGRSVLAVYERA